MRDELEAYGAGLGEKTELIALNKADTIDEELAEALAAELREASGARVFIVSGATGAGVEPILDAIVTAVGALKAPAEAEASDWSPL